MILTSTLPLKNGIMTAGKHSIRLPMIAPKDEPSSPLTLMGSMSPRPTSLSVPSRTRLPSRSRTGCWTCRSRKVKCDENRPSCGQCARLGHRCDYSPRLTFRDDTARVVERMTEVSTEGNVIWDSRACKKSQPAKPLDEGDYLPPFFMLTSDEDREKKAQSTAPGTYHVVANPDSFANLPDYADDTSSVDLNIQSLKIRRGSATSPMLSPKDEPRSSIDEHPDPNIVILETFEDSKNRSPVSNSRKSRLSPASDITSVSTLASPTFFSTESQGPLTRSPVPAMYSNQEELLLAHFRSVVWRQLIQGQASHELFSPISTPVTPGIEVFEHLASSFPPLFHAMMAVSDLSLARRHRSKSVDALQYYYQTFPSLQNALRDTNDLCCDGLFLTHFLLLIYEVAAADEGGSNLWSHHMDQLTQISLMRVSQYGSEHYPYIIWVICNIDLMALLSGAGPGDFLKTMLDNNLVPNPRSQLYPLDPSGYSVVYPEEQDTLLSVLHFNHETFLLAARLAFLASNARQQMNEYHIGTPQSPHQSFDTTRNLFEIRESFHRLWDNPQAHYLFKNMRVLPQRSREILQNALSLYHSCMIFSYNGIWQGELAGSDHSNDESIAYHAESIIHIAGMIVHSSQFDLRFIIFPLFMAGVSSSSSGHKTRAMELISSMDEYGIGRNATTTLHLLQMVYQAQNDQLMNVGHSANVAWSDIMVQQGMQIVNFGL